MRLIILPLLSLPLLASAQFGNFFEGMFGGGGQQQQQQQQQQRNVASDGVWYRQTHDSASCSNYLCPGTLSCVDKPTHCPCPWPEVEEKYELDPDGLAICVSKSSIDGATKRKVNLARKGML